MSTKNTNQRTQMHNNDTKTSNKTSSKKKEKLPFLENNFRFSPPQHTQTPNELFDLLAPSLKEGELRVILFLIRKTYGWHLKWEKITYEEIEIGTGMKKDACIKSTNSLVEKGLVEKIQTGSINHLENYYRLRMDEDSNNVSGYSKNTPPGYSKNTPPPSALKKPRKKLIKDNTESPETPLPKPIPKKAAKPTTAPSSPIIPLFSYSWKNKTTGDFEKIENGITQKEMEKLLEIGLKETEIRQICNEMAAWAERSNGTIRFKNANVYKKILDWKRKKDLKKEEKKQLNKEKEARKEMDYSEREQKNIPDVEGKRQDDFKAYITKVRENPKNSLICNLIRPNGGCTNAELFRINGRTLHSTLNYNEVNYKDKMAAWMKDMTQEFKERDKLKNSWG